MKVLFDVIYGNVGKLCEVSCAEAAACGSNQTEHVLLSLRTVKQSLKLALHVSPDHLRRTRGNQHSHDARVAQRMIIRDVDRNRRVRPPGHNQVFSATFR